VVLSIFPPLARDFFAVVAQGGAYRGQQFILQGRVVLTTGSVRVVSCQDRFTPGICLNSPPEAWKTIRLAKSDDPPGGSQGSLLIEFHEMHAHEAQVDHFADHRADLYAVSDPNAILSDQEEIPDDGYQHALHGDGEAGGE